MRKSVILFIAMALLTALLAIPVQAQVQLPHAFYGTVLVNGSPAPDGTVVRATVDAGSIIAVQNPVTTEDGSYGINSQRLLVQGDIPDGATIRFYVDDIEVEGVTDTFQEGGGPTQKNLSVTKEVTPTSTPGDGGAGGATTTGVTTVSVTGLTASVTLKVDAQGVVQSDTTLTTADGKLSLFVAKGTKILDAKGNPLTSFTATLEPSPLAAPPAGAILLAYNLGPDGATFEPPLTLNMSYDPEDLPEDLTEDDLSIAYWDGTEWVVLETTVDAVAETVTSEVSHFTIFAVVAAPPPAPAAFTVSSLSIQPAEVKPGEVVTITVLVANTGGTEGSYNVILNINGVKEDEKSVALGVSQSQQVNFSVSRDKSGSYAVTIDGLSGSFTVAEPEAPPISEPAAFSLTNLSIQPAEVKPGEAVTITVLVANTGSTEGSHTVVLNVNGAKEDEKSITLGAGQSQQVSFSVSRDKSGSYAVTIDGLSGSFTVAEPEVVHPVKPSVNWGLIGGIIGAVILVALVVLYFVRKRAVG